MNNTQPPITLEEAIYLRNKLNDIFFSNEPNLKKVVYNSKEVDEFLRIVNSERVGIPKGTSPKEIGITLEKWFEILKQQQTTETPTPEYVSNTTLTPEQLKYLREIADSQAAKTEAIKTRKKEAVAKFQEEGKKAFQEQQKSEALKNKKVVVIPTEQISTITLDDKEKQTILTFSKAAKEDPNTLEKFIETKIKESLVTAATEYKNITPDIITKSATSITENFISLPDYQSIEEIPSKISVVHPSSPFTGLASLNSERLKKIIPDDKIRQGVVEAAQTWSLVVEAENNINYAGMSAVFGNNMAPIFYGPQDGHVTQFEVTDDQKDPEGEGSEIDIKQLYDNTHDFNNFYQKIRGAKTAEEAVSVTTTLTPVYSEAKYAGVALKTGSVLAKALPAVGAVYGLRQGYLATRWARMGQKALPLSGQKLLVDFASHGIATTVASSRFLYSKPVEFAFGKFVIGYQTASNGTRQALAFGVGYGEKNFAFLAVKQGTNVTIGRLSISSATKAGTTAITVGTKTGLTLGVRVMVGLSKFASAAMKIMSLAGGWVGAAIGWIVSDVLVKLIEKINWPKIKKWFQENGLAIAGVAGVTAALAFGAVPGVVIGVGTAVVLGGAGALVTGAFGMIGFIGRSIGVAIATPVIVTLLVLPPLVAFIMLIINNSAYLVPPQASTFQNIVSPYMDVVKTPIPSGPFQNSDLPLTVEYKITIRAKKSALSNVRIGYECSVIKEGLSEVCPAPIPVISADSDSLNTTSTIPTTVDFISPTSAFSFSYKQEYPNGRFEDTLVSDTITVTADVPEELGVKASGSAGVKIGNPPDTCPSIWPVDGQYQVFQTPGGGYSHKTLEAIDIGTPNGITIKATHSGKASVVYTAGGYRPLYIDITSICEGKSIITRYAHLSAAFIKNGDTVNLNQPIGASGSDGEGPHLHYEFIGGLKMIPPYIPKPIIRNCSGYSCGMLPI